LNGILAWLHIEDNILCSLPVWKQDEIGLWHVYVQFSNMLLLCIRQIENMYILMENARVKLEHKPESAKKKKIESSGIMKLQVTFDALFPYY
jgi:hypothetical protein